MNTTPTVKEGERVKIVDGNRRVIYASDFNLIRENGSRVRLSDYRDKQTVVLVFFRGQT